MADIDSTVNAALADDTKPAGHTARSAAMPHMLKAADLAANWAARSADTGFATAALLPWRIDPHCWPQIWFELWQMQDAVWQRQRQLQNAWMQGWRNWVTECTQARGGNTITRQIAQELNLIAQWHDLLRGQVTDVVSLAENIEINYAYWVAEKLR
jgi:hypothetical protein